MSGVKWIRIKTNISLDAKFKQIDTMPDADSIECMWFKLIRFSGRLINDGIFLINDKMAYSEQMLSKEFNRPIELIRKAMNTFYKLRMIDIEYEESDMEKQIVASKTSDKAKPEKESTHFVKLRTNEQNFKAIIAGNESFSLKKPFSKKKLEKRLSRLSERFRGRLRFSAAHTTCRCARRSRRVRCHRRGRAR